MEVQPRTVTNHTSDGNKVHRFQTLVLDFGYDRQNKIQPTDKTIAAFDLLTQPPRFTSELLICLVSPCDSPEQNPNCRQEPPRESFLSHFGAVSCPLDAREFRLQAGKDLPVDRSATRSGRILDLVR